MTNNYKTLHSILERYVEQLRTPEKSKPSELRKTISHLKQLIRFIQDEIKNFPQGN